MLKLIRNSEDHETNEKVINMRWEKCARLLLLNSYEELEELKQVLFKIFENIRQFPLDIKYRKLKLSNKLFSQKVINRDGGLDFMIASGFEMKTDDYGEKILVLSLEEDFNNDGKLLLGNGDASYQYQNTLAAIDVAWEWLIDTLSICENIWKMKMEKQSQKSTSIRSSDSFKLEPCCECIIQIKLPTGVTVSGGFMSGDKLIDVRNYACAYFKPERIQDVRLCQSHNPQAFQGNEMEYTLKQLNLLPRASFIATVYTEKKKELIFEQTEKEIIQKNQKVKQEQYLEKIKKLDKRQMELDERKKILSAFKDDRGK